MSAKFILRFDDFCPKMNWEVWDQLEAILTKHGIKPIIAVVPDNQDPKLDVSQSNPLFWERVSAWQSAGWSIAIHGYQHLYSNTNSGLMKINNYSEFAGLSYEENYHKLEAGLQIFSEHNIKVDAWIAPAHSFDANTVKALLALNINVISDGFYWRPLKRQGATWIPSQMWRFRPMPFGLWTVCKHINRYTNKDIKDFECDIERYKSDIIAFNQALDDYTICELTLFDTLFEKFWHSYLKFRQKIQPVVNMIKRIFKVLPRS